jgi:hypothetical protein
MLLAIGVSWVALLGLSIVPSSHQNAIGNLWQPDMAAEAENHFYKPYTQKTRQSKLPRLISDFKFD